MLKKSIPALFSLLHNPRALLSVHNYMKTFSPTQVTRHHGHFRVDQYTHFDQDDSQVEKFIREEQKKYKEHSKKWSHITDEYYQISASRRDNRLTSVAEQYDHYEYFTKTGWAEGVREYVTVHRRQGVKEQLVLDIMQYPHISKYYQTVQLLSTAFSPSHDLIAFSVDLKNNQKSAYFIAKTTGNHQLMKIGRSRSNKIEDAHDLIFASESTVFYIKSEKHRPCRLYTLDLSTGESKQIFHEQNQQFYLGVRLSKSKQYILVSSVSKTASKVWMMRTGEGSDLVQVWDGVGKSYVNHVPDFVVVWNNHQQGHVKLVPHRVVNARKKIDLSKVEGEVVYRAGEHESIQDIDLVKDRVVLYGYESTKPFLKIINYDPKNPSQNIKVTSAKLPFDHGTISPCTNENYQAHQILFSVSTPFVFDQIYAYSLAHFQCRVVQKYSHTGPALHLNKYQVQTVDVPATDMTHIPLTIIGPKKKNIRKLILNFYGCYGLGQRVNYDNVSIAALEKGWTVCHAHVRGGNEKGHKWHSSAQGDNRVRTWLDVEECVGYLIREQYTNPALLFLQSSSAGAIHLWNIINRKPYLYKGAIFRAPFLDVLTSLMDPSQPLSNTDYEQFGNPLTNARIYRQLAAISPYENIHPREYPAIHITAGSNDYRTPIGQIAKFASRFRDRAVSNPKLEEGFQKLLVNISDTGSHLGEASVKEENYRACDVFGYMDYVIERSKDCRTIRQ